MAAGQSAAHEGDVCRLATSAKTGSSERPGEAWCVVHGVVQWTPLLCAAQLCRYDEGSLEETDIDSLLNAADSDNTGDLDFQEFKDMLKAGNAQ